MKLADYPEALAPAEDEKASYYHSMEQVSPALEGFHTQAQIGNLDEQRLELRAVLLAEPSRAQRQVGKVFVQVVEHQANGDVVNGKGKMGGVLVCIDSAHGTAPVAHWTYAGQQVLRQAADAVLVRRCSRYSFVPDPPKVHPTASRRKTHRNECGV